MPNRFDLQTEHLPNTKNIRTTPEAQGKPLWKPPVGTLGRLTAQAWDRARKLEADVASLGAGSVEMPEIPSLREALRKPTVGLVAELKRSSPSKGQINPRLDARRQSVAYEEGGAAAISVLTEPASFGGSDADVGLVRAATSLPILKKDFHVSEGQLLEARRLGASAALVIVRAIEPSRVGLLACAAREIGLEIVFEVRDEAELRIAVEAGAEIIGVNNRNLETLEIDPTTVERILPLIPGDFVAIAESGYSERKHVEAAARSGADGVLVGSSISAADDAVAAVRELVGVSTTSRRR